LTTTKIDLVDSSIFFQHTFATIKMKIMKILVTGATGQMGNRVIETLLKKIAPQRINLITRNEEKRLEFEAKGFNAYLGDYDNIISLEEAMDGVDTVLLISSGNQGDRMQEHRNVIDASKKCVYKISPIQVDLCAIELLY
jgi:uncharacterized protein YbjT (DUF2867 family)